MDKSCRVRKANPSDAAAIAKVQVESYQTAYKGLLPDEFLENFTLQEQESDWLNWHVNHPEDILLVAFDDKNQIVGYALNRKLKATKTTGETLALHVLPSLKHNGIGKLLLAHSVLELKKIGCNSLILWTLIDNPSRGFYEHLNGRCVDEKDWIIEELDFMTKEICYRWNNLNLLLTSITIQDADQ
ncbi:MAG: hypothetical protein C0410_00495 [Anaerolinea sp.]|nr:hypothetical protein [Anaerolinea sp.]